MALAADTLALDNAHRSSPEMTLTVLQFAKVNAREAGLILRNMVRRYRRVMRQRRTQAALSIWPGGAAGTPLTGQAEKVYDRPHHLCARVQRLHADLRALLGDDVGTNDAGKQLVADLASLSNRTRRPEIRILIVGPLKSGKSTLMNVLLRNANVSQVNALPAYPCAVEVRDLERDEAGRPIRSPLYSIDAMRTVFSTPTTGSTRRRARPIASPQP